MDENDKPTVPPVVTPAQDYSQAPSLQQPAPGWTPSDAFGGLVPGNNSASLVAYYVGVAGLVPCFAPICGPIAIVYGRKGLAAYNANPAVKGRGHSLFGIIAGSFETFVTLVFVILILIQLFR